MFILLIIILVIIFIYIVASYNKLVRFRVDTDNTWSQIDVQLKRRHDLIPNLVETVKGVMEYEKETLTRVMEARAKAMKAPNMDERLSAEGEISGLLGRLMAVWENYPELKANQNAMALQEELVSTENRIAYARSHYNDRVAAYNTTTESFPTNVIATFFSFNKKEFFDIPETDKEVPQVKL